MTILVVLVGLLLSHYVPLVWRLRRVEAALWPLRLLTRWKRRPAVLQMLALIFLVLLFNELGTRAANLVAGAAGWPLLALIVLVWTLGPRDLDRDVSQALSDAGATHLAGVDENCSGPIAGAAVIRAARIRWFGILFWFVVLGIPGALLYRFCQQLQDRDWLEAGEQDWLARLNWVLEWPVILLMTLSLGLVTDLDKVVSHWKRRLEVQRWWQITPALLDDSIALLVGPEADRTRGLQRAHQLAWRMLVLWLVIMSLMLIAGWMV